MTGRVTAGGVKNHGREYVPVRIFLGFMSDDDAFSTGGTMIDVVHPDIDILSMV